jgi:TolA-binding protein
MREGLIALIVLVAIYMLFVLLRMRHLRGRPLLPPQQTLPAAIDEVKEPRGDLPGQASLDEVAIPQDAGLPMEPVREEEEEARSSLEQELAQLRDEVDAIRGELAALRGDMQQELASLRASQTVSPIYGDAMQLAVSGYDSAAIAERCGIARAEADLVVALAKSQER